jgi:hypothetical protein
MIVVGDSIGFWPLFAIYYLTISLKGKSASAQQHQAQHFFSYYAPDSALAQIVHSITSNSIGIDGFHAPKALPGRKDDVRGH